MLGKHARAGDVFLLEGELGAGKTCLTQGIARGLGVKEQARSPTFVLVSEYHGRLVLYHIDLYRLDTVEEVWDLGLDDAELEGGVSVVEWAEKAPEVFSERHLHVRLEVVDETVRRLSLSGCGGEYGKVLAAVGSAAGGS